MPTTNKIFRIFVSSTFADMRTERGILQSDVFPKLKRFCEERGALFQVIDLRWGVNEESQREQKTMEICLNEITRCQKLSPRPNFIVLLGDRYGWQPISNKIPSSEMMQLKEHFNKEAEALITTWYKEDTNAIPPEYVLQPRGEEYNNYGAWQAEEDKLRKILRVAVNKTNFSVDQRTKYLTSATHQEIINGALMSSEAGVDPTEHVFAYLRTIDNLPQNRAAREFIDLVDGAVDPYAKEQMVELKEELKKKLPKHIYEYQAQWVKSNLTAERTITYMLKTENLSKGNAADTLRDFLKGGIQFDEKVFADRVYENLISVIERELKEITQTDELTKEKSIHIDFKEKLTEFFTGQEEVLLNISTYLEKSSGKPLVLIGPSGSGKSSIIAKTILSLTPSLTKGGKEGFSVYRFIGITSSSSNLNSLLRQLCDEIVKEYSLELKSLMKDGEDEKKLSNYEGLKEMFTRCVTLASEEKPLLIFLDALDQLQTARYDFLNIKLPAHARIIISALPALEEKLSFADIFKLPLMNEKDGKNLLKTWLDSEERTLTKDLTKDQTEQVIDKFRENGLPIYLKLAFEQARKWHSYDEPRVLPRDVEGILSEYFDLLEKAHTKELVSKAIGYLLSGKYVGLAESEILDILVFDDEYWQGFLKSCHQDHRADVEEARKLPIVIWSRLYLDLETYLTERDADGIKIIKFYHRVFGEYARKRYLLGDAYACNVHLKLADYFERQPKVLRTLTELLWQLQQAGERDRLRICLLDIGIFPFILKRNQNELLAYWVWLGEEREMGKAYLALKSLEYLSWDTNRIEKDLSQLQYFSQFDRRIDLAGVSILLAQFFMIANLYAEAEPLLRLALVMLEWIGKKDNPDVAEVLDLLATLLQATNRTEEAEPLQQRALAIDESDIGANYRAIIRDLNNKAERLRNIGQFKEAEPLYRKAWAIAKLYEIDKEPEFTAILNNLAIVFQYTNRMCRAEALLRRSVKILEASKPNSEDEHPNLPYALSNLARLLLLTNRLEEAESLIRRALTLDVSSKGKDSPDVAIRLDLQASLLEAKSRWRDALLLYRQAVEILETFNRTNGHEHPYYSAVQKNLKMLQRRIIDKIRNFLIFLLALGGFILWWMLR